MGSHHLVQIESLATCGLLGKFPIKLCQSGLCLLSTDYVFPVVFINF